ncbi:hypothetical protein [Nannocystis pusilla]|uniref:Uncharacterized protein n=1 Tax=Nannocystis pusilla TaxID=889268 RepID=A0ABS7TPU0_9BACT|nr:hypothetical protein [Nannocystis pusilla]MBZ5710162.1 hypothetical protein [Nannocystis pusilla]
MGERLVTTSTNAVRLVCGRNGVAHEIRPMVHHVLATALLFTHPLNPSLALGDEDDGASGTDRPLPEKPAVDASDGLDLRTGFLIDAWGAEAAVESYVVPGRYVEVVVSLAGQPHIIIAGDGNDDKRVWLSERAGEMGLRSEFLQHVGSDEALFEVRKNPACGVFKWAISAVLTAAFVSCCTNLVSCVGCTIVGKNTQKKIDGINCNNECKPECPI